MELIKLYMMGLVVLVLAILANFLAAQLGLKNSQEKKVNHIWMILPLLCTFMLGPLGVLIYTLVLLTQKKLFTRTT